MAKLYIAGAIAALVALPATAQQNSNASKGCSPADSQFCQNMRNADQVYQQQQQARQRAEMDRLNQQNGASQYTGPTVRQVPGGFVGGYQRSTP